MLRPEANPIDKCRLFSEQRKAYDELERLLDRANPSGGPRKEQPGDPRSSLRIPYKDFRTNRIIFIDGVAGVGKTTVYLTFKYYNEREEKEQENKKEQEQEKKEKYVWLDPLELAILDSPSNALAELLTHIERKCSKTNGESSSLNDKQEKALRDLKNLQSKIALLWDGNPRERAARVSPQGFAAEVVAASEGRAELRTKLNELIDEIAKLFFGGRLLILPIDDLHENPSVALGLLRLMRLVHSPHLVILALGNLHSLGTIEQLRARHQLTSFLHETDAHDSDILSEVKSRAATLGAFSMSKLFCPSQTIKVYPPDTDDDKDSKHAQSDWTLIQNFIPDGSICTKGLVSLFVEKLNESFLALGEPYFKNLEARGKSKPKKTLEKILNFSGSGLVDKQRRRLFKMPVRHLVSMYRTLERDVKYPVELCYEMFEQSRFVEYNSGLPDNVFEFDTEDINLIKIKYGYRQERNKEAGQGPTALLRYHERKDQDKDQSGTVAVTTHKSVRPEVAAWAHLLLCLHEWELLSAHIITKESQEDLAKKDDPETPRESKKDSKKKGSKND